MADFDQKDGEPNHETDSLREWWEDAALRQRPEGVAPGVTDERKDDRGIGVGPEFRIRIIDFIINRCEATHSQQFVESWLVTSGCPCLICDVDKSKCGFYAYLESKRALSLQEDLP